MAGRDGLPGLGALVLVGEVGGYYGVSELRGVTGSRASVFYEVFWLAAALVIGPVVGLAGLAAVALTGGMVSTVWILPIPGTGFTNPPYGGSGASGE